MEGVSIEFLPENKGNIDWNVKKEVKNDLLPY